MKADEYRNKLDQLVDWDEYLLKESGLPGPRGNLELAQVVAEKGDRELFFRYVTLSADLAPVNSPYEFLAFCGVVGLGRLLAEGEVNLLEDLRRYASDSRWRIREGVAMALQRLGDVNMDQLILAMRSWSLGSPLVQRAAAAALCEPRLLRTTEITREVLSILDQITASVEQLDDRRGADFLALRKGLGYCWSVATASLPSEGKVRMEKWLNHPDRDIRWIMRENLKKARLARLDSEWVRRWQEDIGD